MIMCIKYLIFKKKKTTWNNYLALLLESNNSSSAACVFKYMYKVMKKEIIKFDKVSLNKQVQNDFVKFHYYIIWKVINKSDWGKL